MSRLKTLYTETKYLNMCCKNKEKKTLFDYQVLNYSFTIVRSI